MGEQKLRVVAYCRVSTNSKDQANSFQNQKTYFEREISKNKRYKFVNIYADKGITGTKLHRPQFDQMLYDAGLDIVEVSNIDNDKRIQYKKYVTIPSSSRKPLFDLILTKNTSRFARNVEVETILRDLTHNKVYVHFLDLNKSTENKDDITYIQIFQSFDERESRDKSTKVSFGVQEGLRRGVVRTNSKIYGYKYIQEQNRLIIIHKEAEIVKLIFKLYSDGFGIRRIINKLNEMKIKTRNDVNFGKTTIHRILNNEKYAGLNNPCKYDNGVVFNKNTYAKVKNNYIVKKTDKIEPIISEELFYKCQKLMQSKINYINQKGNYNGISKYSSLFYCGLCGSPYHRNIDKGRKFYNCSNKKKNGTKACNNVNINESYLDNFFEKDFIQWFHNIYETRKMKSIQQIYVSILELNKLFDCSHKNKDIKLCNELIRLKEKLDGYRELYAMSKTDREKLKDKIYQTELEIITVNEEYQHSIKSNVDIANEIIDKYNLSIAIKNSKKYYNTKDEILEQCSKIFVFKDMNTGKPIFNFKIKDIDDLFEATKLIKTDMYYDKIDKKEINNIVVYAKKIIEISK